MKDMKKHYDDAMPSWEGYYADPDHFFTRRAGFVRDLILRRVPGRGRALDIGCATGYLSGLLSQIGFEVYGIDISEKMIQKARKNLRVPDDRFRVCKGEEIPFGADYFDLVTATGVFMYVKDYNAYIKKITHVLKEGGFVAATCANRLSVANFSNIVKVMKTSRTNAEWRSTIINLIHTGIWSGGNVDYRKAKQAYNSRAFDRLFCENGYLVVGELNLYAISRFGLDRNPFDRKKIGRYMARRLAWSHMGLYQKGHR